MLDLFISIATQTFSRLNGKPIQIGEMFLMNGFICITNCFDVNHMGRQKRQTIWWPKDANQIIYYVNFPSSAQIICSSNSSAIIIICLIVWCRKSEFDFGRCCNEFWLIPQAPVAHMVIIPFYFASWCINYI